jgi:hypothetical protein
MIFRREKMTNQAHPGQRMGGDGGPTSIGLKAHSEEPKTKASRHSGERGLSAATL